MKKSKSIAVFTIALGLLVSGAVAGTAKATSQTKCPVMNYPIDEKTYVDHDGKRIFFCCAACPDTFKKDPAKYLKKMSDEGVTPAKAK